MLLLIHHAGKLNEVNVQQDEAVAQTEHLTAAIEAALDVSAHKQKLIFKGKVLETGKQLAAYGVKNRSKVMLLASATDAQKEQKARQQAEDRRQNALQRQARRQEKAVERASQAAAPKRPLSPESLTARAQQRWQESGIMSLRGLELTELPRAAVDLSPLGGAVSRIYAMDIGNNHLASIPEDMFSQLQELKKFRCSHNLLTSDSAPWAALASLPKLSHFFASHNRLDTFPAMGGARQLVTLCLSHNDLVQIPDILENLPALEQLDVSHNKLQELPSSLRFCKRLVWLDGSCNRIVCIPATLAGAPEDAGSNGTALLSLRGLILDNNRIQNIPDGLLERCTALHTLSVLDNPIPMHLFREVPGYEAFAKRRKDKLDKIIDARIEADFTEAADYEPFHRH